MNEAERIRTRDALELDLAVCKGLGKVPGQSIADRARDIVELDELNRSLPAEERERAYRWQVDGAPSVWSRQVRAARALLGAAGPWEKMRVAAAILREESVVAAKVGPIHGVNCRECYPTGAPPLNPNAHREEQERALAAMQRKDG